MLFKNPNSKRKNPFRSIYDNEEFKTILQHKGSLPNFSYLVDVELTNHCNLKCIFCARQAMTRDKGFMSEEVLKKVVAECSKFNTPLDLFAGANPFCIQR